MTWAINRYRPPEDRHRPHTQRGQAHVHTTWDGRGERVVMVNGRRVKGAFYADTKRGIVRAYSLPLRADKYNKRCLSYTLRGDVVVGPVLTPPNNWGPQ